MELLNLLQFCKNLLAWEARATDFASSLLINHSRHARRLCCLALLALLRANRASLSRKASLNLSAMCSSGELFESDGTKAGLLGATDTAHAWGSMSSMIEWSSVTEANASSGTCTLRMPIGDGCGLTIMRGHSVDKHNIESSSILGCKW